MRGLLSVAAIVMVVAIATSVMNAQRRITPVGAPEQIDPSKIPHLYDSLGNVVTVDTAAVPTDTVTVDSVPKESKMIYPLIYEVTAGVDIWNPFMRIIGQDYGLASVWGELNMHNRYFPYFEFGMDNASASSEESNFTFKSPASPFFKIGASYNVFYNSNPGYQLKFGLRYGITRFNYRYEGITIDEGYWNQPAYTSISDQTSTAGYLEVVAAVKVKIYRNFSMGWTLKLHTILHETPNQYGEPMIIPGYGNRKNLFTGGFSLMYTFGINEPKTKEFQPEALPASMSAPTPTPEQTYQPER